MSYTVTSCTLTPQEIRAPSKPSKQSKQSRRTWLSAADRRCGCTSGCQRLGVWCFISNPSPLFTSAELGHKSPTMRAAHRDEVTVCQECVIGGGEERAKVTGFNSDSRTALMSTVSAPGPLCDEAELHSRSLSSVACFTRCNFGFLTCRSRCTAVHQTGEVGLSEPWTVSGLEDKQFQTDAALGSNVTEHHIFT